MLFARRDYKFIVTKTSGYTFSSSSYIYGTDIAIYDNLEEAIEACNFYSGCNIVWDYGCGGGSYHVTEGSTSPHENGHCNWVKVVSAENANN